MTFFSDGNSDEDQGTVVRRSKKETRVNPMIQKARDSHFKIQFHRYRRVSWLDEHYCDSIPIQTKKVERDAVSSSESDVDKEEKITVSYKSTRSAVS